MILGRSTVQWTALITAAAGLAQVLAVTLTKLDPTVVATILGSTVAFLAVFIAFLANTSTTPSKDPQLEAGTPIRVTDAHGAVIGHVATPTPEPPPTEAPTPADPEIPG